MGRGLGGGMKEVFAVVGVVFVCAAIFIALNIVLDWLLPRE
jgi:preprotein translocase subunit SecE